MEWYSGSAVEDLAVPNNEEIYDRLPSPDSWSSWGKIMNSSKKLNMLGMEECPLRETMFSSGDVEQRDCQRSRHASRLQNAYPNKHSDIQLNDDRSIVDAADDIFFCSLFEADTTTMDGSVRSTYFTQSDDDLMSDVDLLRERNHIQHCTNIFENAGHFPTAKEFEICASEEQSDMLEDISEEDISMEESVLMDLQRLTVQLAKKTRICFRDSFYRLAENSRHEAECTQNGIEDLENCKPNTSSGPSRLQESQIAKNSDTNAIDRTVATLLFNTNECCNTDATPISELDPGTPQREYQDNSHLYQPNSSISSICTVPGGDAEVPSFGLTNQPMSSLMWS
ncbi:hypothetical protein DH2020_002935 [Rehmannia glutinosa]|uniref:Uncharacterized protein n=1 Tax=Rehmannia glutinosa TaxID=99300 RepID=A0ABR0XVS3_REHGL